MNLPENVLAVVHFVLLLVHGCRWSLYVSFSETIKNYGRTIYRSSLGPTKTFSIAFRGYLL